MATAKQQLGARGEKAVTDRVSCPRCGRAKYLRKLPPGFQCADLICKFCGFLAQVKAATVTDNGAALPARVPSAAWGPQHEQIIAGIYHGLFVTCFQNGKKLVRIDYVPPHIIQATPQVFEPRKPLSATAKRAGWQGHMVNLSVLPAIGIQQLYP